MGLATEITYAEIVQMAANLYRQRSGLADDHIASTIECRASVEIIANSLAGQTSRPLTQKDLDRLTRELKQELLKPPPVNDGTMM